MIGMTSSIPVTNEGGHPMINRYRQALMRNVCMKCLERTGQAVCGGGTTEDCTLMRFLPEVVSIVQNINSASMHDYVHELHNVVCVSCRENDDGNCTLRGTTECPLDFYFPMIVETIKEVQAQEARVGFIP